MLTWETMKAVLSRTWERRRTQNRQSERMTWPGPPPLTVEESRQIPAVSTPPTKGWQWHWDRFLDMVASGQRREIALELLEAGDGYQQVKFRGVTLTEDHLADVEEALAGGREVGAPIPRMQPVPTQQTVRHPTTTHVPTSEMDIIVAGLNERMMRDAYGMILDEQLRRFDLTLDDLRVDRDVSRRVLIAAVHARTPAHEWRVVQVEVGWDEFIEGTRYEDCVVQVLSRLNEKLLEEFATKYAKPDGIRVIRIRRREET